MASYEYHLSLVYDIIQNSDNKLPCFLLLHLKRSWILQEKLFVWLQMALFGNVNNFHRGFMATPSAAILIHPQFYTQNVRLYILGFWPNQQVIKLQNGLILNHLSSPRFKLKNRGKKLNSSLPNIPFWSPWKHQKTFSFLMFSDQKGALGRNRLNLSCGEIISFFYNIGKFKII